MEITVISSSSWAISWNNGNHSKIKLLLNPKLTNNGNHRKIREKGTRPHLKHRSKGEGTLAYLRRCPTVPPIRASWERGKGVGITTEWEEGTSAAEHDAASNSTSNYAADVRKGEGWGGRERKGWDRKGQEKERRVRRTGEKGTGDRVLGLGIL